MGGGRCDPPGCVRSNGRLAGAVLVCPRGHRARLAGVGLWLPGPLRRCHRSPSPGDPAHPACRVLPLSGAQSDMAGAPQPAAAGRRDLRHGVDRHRRSAAAIEDGRRGDRPRLLAGTEPVRRATPPNVVAYGVADDAGRASSDYLNRRTATGPADDAGLTSSDYLNRGTATGPADDAGRTSSDYLNRRTATGPADDAGR